MSNLTTVADAIAVHNAKTGPAMAALGPSMRYLPAVPAGSWSPKPEPRRVVHEGMRTPWGMADSAEIVADGIGHVGTPSHGGMKLDRKRNAMVPAPLRREGGWYEEDCEWAIVEYVFRAELLACYTLRAAKIADGTSTETFYDKSHKADVVAHLERRIKSLLSEDAKHTLWNYFPDGWDASFGGTLTGAQSRTRREQIFLREHAKDWLVTSASGRTAWNQCPDGSVLVSARLGGRSIYGHSTVPNICHTPERHFLVPAAEYEARGDLSFVIDLARHPECDSRGVLPPALT